MDQSLRIGATGPLVNAWVQTMNRRFGSYSKRADGTPLREDAYFGLDDAQVANEWHRRIGLPGAGNPAQVVVTEEQLCILGLGHLLVPLCLTAHGTGVTMWDGPPADVARALERMGKAKHQPIGNYPARPFPMWPSIMQGVAEVEVQVRRYPGRRKYAVGYSQGAVVMSLAFKYGALGQDSLVRAFMFANPCREEGVGGTPGAGAMTDRLVNTPGWWHEYAHPKDIYASVPVEPGWGENVRMVTKLIMGKDWWRGDDDLFEQLGEIVFNPFGEGSAALVAAVKAGGFFGSGTGPHVTGLPVQQAIDYLAA